MTEKKQKILLFFIFIFVISIYLEAIPNNLIGGTMLLLVLGKIFNRIGVKIPVWKDYFGGGPMLALIGSSALVYLNILPKQSIEVAINYMENYKFFDLFVAVLLTGSLLSLTRKQIKKAFSKYFLVILGSIIGSVSIAVLCANFFNIEIKEVLIKYFLPIMGAGTGMGVLPMSDMYSQTTGKAPIEYISFAIPILTLANFLAVIFASIISKVKNPILNGNGHLLKASMDEENMLVTKKYKVTNENLIITFILICLCYIFGDTMSKKILPNIMGIQIHTFVYMTFIVVILNIFDFIPKEYKYVARKIQKFFSTQFLALIMAGVGIAYTDLGEFVNALMPTSLAISVLIVFGSMMGAMIMGKLVGFYPIESGILGGLCMANRGGAGDLMVLGASDRIDLISFAQISTRIGGSFMVIIASIIMNF